MDYQLLSIHSVFVEKNWPILFSHDVLFSMLLYVAFRIKAQLFFGGFRDFSHQN
jgi:hypothetical protein